MLRLDHQTQKNLIAKFRNPAYVFSFAELILMVLRYSSYYQRGGYRGCPERLDAKKIGPGRLDARNIGPGRLDAKIIGPGRQNKKIPLQNVVKIRKRSSQLKCIPLDSRLV